MADGEKKIVECVPNFSEGRDQEVLDQISGAIAATVQVYEATLTRHRKDDLERELPLLVVAQGIQILLAGELDHGRRAAHDDERARSGRR